MHAQRRDNGYMTGSQLHAAIERTYRAGMGDVDWIDALSLIARMHGADGAMLFTPGVPAEAGGLSVSLDANTRPGLRAVSPAGEAQRSACGRAFSTMLADEGDVTLPPTLFLLFRHESAPPLTDDEVEAIQLCCRHLAIAVRLWYRGRLSREGSEALAWSLNAAVLIANEEGQVTWMNRRAEAWIRERRIVIADGRIGEVPDVDFDLARAIRETAKKGARVPLQVGTMITAEVVGISTPHGDGSLGKSALVILRDRTGCGDAAAALAANFRLTATEVDLAIALWKGILIAEYAAQRSVAMSTVRSQLKSLLSKTRSRRQSDIVSLVARMVPLTGDPPSNG